ncbi:MAG: DnaK suppressor protein [Myxococcota bacterium]|jgi:DnaK suppressor protein
MTSKAPPPDEYLTADQTAQLKAGLDEQLTRLLQLGRLRVSEATAERVTDADVIDAAVTETNRDSMLRMADRERRLLKKVYYALRRIQAGEHGTCESCGGAIDYNRLLARPVATLCIDCKTEAEHLEGRPDRAF